MSDDHLHNKIRNLEKQLAEAKEETKRAKAQSGVWKMLYERYRDQYAQIVALSNIHGKDVFEEAIVQQYAYATANNIRSELDYNGCRIVRVHFPEFIATVSLGKMDKN